jgi:hypothetical protein
VLLLLDNTGANEKGVVVVKAEARRAVVGKGEARCTKIPMRYSRRFVRVCVAMDTLSTPAIVAPLWGALGAPAPSVCVCVRERESQREREIIRKDTP